jgi:hypothetical protein
VGPEPDQRLPHRHLELGGHHAGRLVHDVLEVGALLELRRDRSRRGAGLEQEHGATRELGEKERVGVPVAGERTGHVGVEVEGAQSHGTDLEGEGEHGSNAGTEGRSGERRPAGGRRIGEVGLEDRPVVVVGVEARPLAEVVLELLDQRAHRVARAHGAPLDVAGHQHHAGARRSRGTSPEPRAAASRLRAGAGRVGGVGQPR